jgi:ferric-dicitrate binding protein FerR (iron transport regulator)
MTTEDNIKKWLSGELSKSEKIAFESSDEYANLTRMLSALNNFKAPEYDVEGQYSKLSKKSLYQKKPVSIYRRISPLLKVAAIFIVSLALGYFAINQYKSGMNSQEWIASKEEVLLPDSSIVFLNADSKIRFSQSKWDKERNVELVGEAYFKVKKGSTFNVSSPQGTVSVLGTEFVINDRNGYYQVTCYSGRVQVITAQSTRELTPNSVYRLMNDREEQFAGTNLTEPDWLHGESSFNSIPLHLVFEELERQYQVRVENNEIELDQLFTGSFTHDNLVMAMEAITVPVNLDYQIKEDKVILILESK